MSQKTAQAKQIEMRSQLQELIDREAREAAELTSIEQQLDYHETKYLEKSWLDGNIVLGWRKGPMTGSNANHNLQFGRDRPRVGSKDKIFSLSSVTSDASKTLGNISDKHLLPIETRFIPNKRRFNKKSGEARRNRPLRRKRRH